MDVDLRALRRALDTREQAAVKAGHGDGHEIADGEAVVGIDEELGGGVGIVEHEADDEAQSKTLNDGQGQNVDLGAIEGGSGD